MLAIEQTKEFDKCIKILVKKHYNLDKTYEVIKLIAENKSLPGRYRLHSLSSNLKGFQEYHIESNMLLIFKILDNRVILYKLGTHSDILDK